MFNHGDPFAGFSVDDVKRAKSFYAETLGLKVSEGDGMLQIESGKSHVLVYAKPNHTPATFTVLNVPVDDIAAAAADLQKRGVKLESYSDPAIKTDARGIHEADGMKIAWLKDPAGNIVSLLETH